MDTLTDIEFLKEIKIRLKDKGWRTGRIGKIEGPNCLLGAAGFVQHGENLVVDDDGIHPIWLNGKNIEECDWYTEIWGMVRLARIFYEKDPFRMIDHNDGHHDVSEVLEVINSKIAELKGA